MTTLTPHDLSTPALLAGLGLPPGDDHALTPSVKRFPDRSQLRVEIPSVEGPRCFEAVLTEGSDVTPDLGGRATTERMAEAIARRVGEDPR